MLRCVAAHPGRNVCANGRFGVRSTFGSHAGQDFINRELDVTLDTYDLVRTG